MEVNVGDFVFLIAIKCFKASIPKCREENRFPEVLKTIKFRIDDNINMYVILKESTK